MKQITEQEMISIAKRAIQKNWSYDDLKYGDDLYGREEYAEQVWEYVRECREIGEILFYQKYAEK